MTMRGPLSKGRAVIGLIGAQLRHYRFPTALAVVGVALAVLLMVLLSGLGYGVTSAGTEGLAWLELDLWLTAGPIQFTPAAVGGVQNPILDAHPTAAQLSAREDVRRADALAFQVVYASTNESEFETLVGVGLTGNSSTINVREGPGFETADVHYANGSYSGPMTHAVIIDERTANRFNVSVGDSLYIGGTLATARENEFTVVGVSRRFSTFLGTSTVTLHLAELQTLTGTTGTDPASLITVRASPSADIEALQADLEEEYPRYEVRTNQEQLEAVVGQQTSVLASAAAVVVIAIIVGLALVVNVLGLLVHHQRSEFAALKAAGMSGGSLFAVIGGQGIAIGVLGGLLGVAFAPVGASILNPTIENLAGFPELIKLPPWVLAAGGALALVTGCVGSLAAGWRILRLNPLEHLRK